jgi:mRNA-degrading endonuclease toxin of MazEF toxin-antitoxin module
LPRDCVVNCDWLMTIPKDDLVERAGALGDAMLARLDSALLFALGLE